jgi:hypothetical protein
MTYTITKYVVAEFAIDAQRTPPEYGVDTIEEARSLACSPGEKVFMVEYDIPIFEVRACRVS